jgi:hypothetical protein
MRMLYWSVFLATLEACQTRFLNSCGIVLYNGMQCYHDCSQPVPLNVTENIWTKGANKRQCFLCRQNELAHSTPTQKGRNFHKAIYENC